MAAVDPTYPLYPIFCILAVTMLLLVLMTSFIRQSWNLGVAFLCFWLFVECLMEGVNAIIWSDNAEIKLYVYCDIVSHLQFITFVVKPMATLLITRRLYLITSLQSVELPDKAARRRNAVVEWTLGLAIPILVAGPFYYIVQEVRFNVVEGFGCTNTTDGSLLAIFLTDLWTVVPPVVSVTLYYPRVARTFYRQSRDIDRFLRSNDSDTSRNTYKRLLALASVDIVLTLPVGVVNIALTLKNALSFYGSLPAYLGWTKDHTGWKPSSSPYADLVAQGTFSIALEYFSQWSSPFLALTIFGLFGVTSEARASYWRVLYIICGWFGWKPTPPTSAR